MKYSNDRPIYNKEQDLLCRSTFSDQLAKAIYEYKDNTGLVVGLFGKWGTGKTSIINMTENEINQLAESSENKPVIVRFDPWNYSDKDNLISIFFKCLKNSIDLQEDVEFKNKIGGFLREYADAFDALALIPMIGSGLAAVLKTICKVNGEKLIEVPDLRIAKEKLESKLVEANKKIIIIIDDIDRLTNSQIRDIFQLVKQVADFPNVIYVLLMDRDIVRSALKEVHNISGDEYLEKIIQIPFEIPLLGKDKVNDILLKRLHDVVDKIDDNVEWDGNYFESIFLNCVSPYVNNLRDVNRVINVFQFRYGALYKETAFEDLLAITTIEVLEPQLYKWMHRNRNLLCGEEILYTFINKKEPAEYRKIYSDEFEKLDININCALKCISTIFPYFKSRIESNNYTMYSNKDLRANMRVANGVKFNTYFTLNLEDIKVSRDIINKCICTFNTIDLRREIQMIIKNEESIYFLEEMRVLVDKIPYERLELIASVIVELSGDFQDELYGGFLLSSASEFARILLIDIINRFETEEERYKFICNRLNNISTNEFDILAQVIKSVEFGYGRISSVSENSNAQLVSIMQLEKIEKIYVDKCNSIMKAELINNKMCLRHALFLWQWLDENGAQDFLNKLFEDEIKKLRFVCCLANRWYSGGGVKGWTFNEEVYSKYIPKEEIYLAIQRIDKSELALLSETEQLKLASFMLNYDRDETGSANEHEAQSLVNSWKHN